MSSQEQPLLKLDSVLSAEQMHALLQEATTPQNDKLDFDVLGNVGGSEDGNHALAAIDDNFHDLENLVLDQGAASGALFAETSEADVEALLKANLGAEDLLSPIDLVLLDHCYCTPIVGQLVSEEPAAAPETVLTLKQDHDSPQDEADGDDAGLVSPGSPQQPLRRSQRQIERIDRERLERIKAENAEQKRREQEEMAGLLTPVLGAESPQAPPPVPAAFSSPLLSPMPAVVTPPRVTSPVQPQPQHQLPQEPPLTIPTTPKEKTSAVASTMQSKPVRRAKVRNSESTSSTEDVPEDGMLPAVSPTRARKKRLRDDPECAETAKPKKSPVSRKSNAGVAAPVKGRRDSSGCKKGPPPEEEAKEEHRPPARRKSDDGETKKRKHTPEPISPFGKVVKVVRTTPEAKKRPRRESFTDEPALFSQPDVLHKEHEPQAAPVPTPPPAAPPPTVAPAVPTTAAPRVPGFPSEESVYDSVEAHVARLAGGLEHSLTPTTTVAAPASPVTGAPVAPALAPTVSQHKHGTAAKHGPAENKSLLKKPMFSKPVAAKSAHPGQPDHKKSVLPVAVKSAPPPSSPAKVKHAAQHTAPLPKTPKLAKVSSKMPQGKPPGSAKKPEPHKLPKKTRSEQPPPPVAAAQSATPPDVVVAERPKRQSKEKFKRAMMRKREMGRRVDDEDVEDSSDEVHDSDWSSEDDPERLWCICRKPHNDKFMIECDRCKDWFHGTCVGVTRQQGRLLEKENKEWVCPKCSKDENRGVVAAAPKKELHRQLSSEDKTHLVKSHHAKTGHTKHAHQPKHADEHGMSTVPAVKPAPPAPKAVVRECLVCKRKAECIGLYCGRDCIAKYVHDASQTIKAAKLDGERRLMFTERSSGKLVAGVQVPTPENLTNWLVRNPTFELAVARTPGRPHSAKQPSSKAAQAKQPHSKSVKQPPAAQVQSAAPSGANTTTAAAPTPSSTTNSAPAESTSSGTEAVAEVKKTELAQPSIEPVRLNVRKMLRDSLLNRCKEASDLSLSGDEVRRMALRIEEELFKVFRDTGTRYKSKYRSLVFNIKDSRNQGLFRKILRGKIAPDRLVRMTPEELASKELARWREQENKHAIEMIKKEQMEAAQNVSSHALLKKTHKGEVEIDDDNLRLLEKAEEKAVANQPEPPAAVARVTSVVGSTTATTEAVDKSSRDTTDAHRSHLFDLNCKICTGKIAPPPDDRLTPSPPPSRRSSTASVPAQPSGSLPTPADELSSSSTSSSSSPPPPPPVRGRSGTPPPSTEQTKGLRRPQEDFSDLEPSSTVSLGSPDSGKGGSKQPQPASVWKGFISMQEVSKFVTAAYKVSGPTDFLSQQDIPDTINVCGRIIPDQVWDYLSKIKQSGNKELLVVRFQPANDEEKRPYRELYTYLNSRKRCGVVGGLSRMLKDFYILPLPSHSPVPTVLMPFDGPGLQSGRPHMLLGIIVRHKNRLRPPSGKSRSSWADRSEAVSLTPPLAETSVGGQSDDEEPYEPSYTPPLEKRPRQARLKPSSSALSEERTPLVDDEDVPYDPEENEVGIAGTPTPTEEPPPPPPPRVSGQAVSELIERISAGANPAAVTTSVLASLASNANLEHQKRLLVELTQEVEEQKRQIELQRLQAIQLSMGKASSSTPPQPATPSEAQPVEASGIPFLDSSLPTDTGLSFLSGTGTSSGGCSLPSSLQELLNKVKAPMPQQASSSTSSIMSDVLGTLLSSSGPLVTSAIAAVGSPQHMQSPLGAKKTLTEDPIVRHFADDDVATESDAEGAGATPPPPGIGDSPPGTAGVATSARGTMVGVSRSPGTPTKDELVNEDVSRPQDPRRRKAVASALQSASTSSPVVSVSPLVTVSSSSGSQLGAKSASELMEMARKQLEEMEVPPPPNVVVQQPQLQQPIAAPAAPPPPPVYGAPPPASLPPAGLPPAGMPPTSMPPPHPSASMAPPANLVPPTPGMYGPPPPLDPSAYGAPPGIVPPGYPPPPQWSTAGDPYWKGPPQAGWSGGGRSGEYRQRGGPPSGWRGRRNQWEH
ncbi:protein partner of snf isoform X4 [Rhipicephalus microplus]|uniref:protein partner of snf isoform X4 n=1 Tax=Rhipicephalus microplus TaxID=6941 RepID=UPI003F6B40C4